jgi:transposase-like protein
MSAQLTRISNQATAVADAQTKLRRFVREAHANGASVIDLANAAGVTRQTIYAWLGMRGTNERNTP